MIKAGSELFFHPQGREQGPDPVPHLFRLQRAVDALEDAELLVEVDERLRLLVVGLEAMADHLGLVVVADDQSGAADVADALVLRRVEVDVEDVAVLGAGAAAD